ncbi:MAG: hypothetical protein CVU89_09775 [Firmicutes bacterium HGW-Firmicutes-14]|nr:MAG: hypothetical protein CVU89_09775 [Firmicutes bacterium HGW-Firmicutes-14]
MDTVRVIVKSILIIIMMTAFLEIVLPRSDMKRYINLIIGLFVIIAVLNPFLSLVSKPLDFDVLGLEGAQGSSDTESLIKKGKDIAQKGREQAVSSYKEKLSGQIMALSAFYRDANVTRADVDIVEDPGDEDFGQIRKVVLIVGGPDDRVLDSSPVKVDEIDVSAGPGDEKKEESGPASEGYGELKELVAGFYGLTPEQVVIRK